MFLFRVPTLIVGLAIGLWVVGITFLGIAVGRRLRATREGLQQPIGVIQAALLTFVAVLLAFGLAMGVDRYESRRQAVVVEANTIGTTYLRAQLLPEPQRSRALRLLSEYADARLELSNTDVETKSFDAAVSKSHDIQRTLWSDGARRSPLVPTTIRRVCTSSR